MLIDLLFIIPRVMPSHRNICSEVTPVPDESPSQLDRRKEDLFDLIIAVLRRHPMLCYFQGFHDIMQVLLLVLGKEEATSAAEYVSLLRIRDYMLPSISASTSHLQLLPAILRASDPHLQQHLSRVQPFFALPAMLTLYAHEIQEYGDIARLFDFFLACEAAMPLYFFAIVSWFNDYPGAKAHAGTDHFVTERRAIRYRP